MSVYQIHHTKYISTCPSIHAQGPMLSQLSDLLPPDIQTPNPLPIPKDLYSDVPTRIRPASFRSPRLRTLLPPLGKYTDVGNSHAYNENRQEQFPTSSRSRVQCCQISAEKTKTANQLGRVGWVAAGMLCAEEQDAEREFFGHDYGDGDVRSELSNLVCAERCTSGGWTGRAGK